MNSSASPIPPPRSDNTIETEAAALDRIRRENERRRRGVSSLIIAPASQYQGAQTGLSIAPPSNT